MNNINYGRVVLGGLVAGVVLNIGEFLLNGVIFAQQMQELFARFNVPQPGASFMAVATLLTFALGIMIVWLYAMIRPRYGPGPKTAVCAALTAWFFICFYTGVINGMIWGVPVNLLVIGNIWCVVEYVLAALAGAYLYKEA